MVSITISESEQMGEARFYREPEDGKGRRVCVFECGLEYSKSAAQLLTELGAEVKVEGRKNGED